jgi:acyl carrier protein
METVATPHARSAILADVVAIIRDMTQDWDLDFAGDINEDTLLVRGLAFQSIDVVMLAGEIHRRYRRTRIPFERLLLSNGRAVDDVRVGALVDFLAHHLRAEERC